MNYLRKIISGLWSLIVGLKITGREFAKPQITIHFPRKEVTNLGTYRGHIELVPLPSAPDKPRCIVCYACVEVCPSRCLSLEAHVDGLEPAAQKVADTDSTKHLPTELMLGLKLVIPDSEKKAPPPDRMVRVLDGFRLNYNLCSLCGLCVQSCPVSSLTFSRDAYLAGMTRKEFEFDLLDRLKERANTR
ncbi:MAG: 4Fe-4S binding protein [Deltaproteobacteria bacterium]|nr:4Fe-4S binding protein [Deltaproteobacteria bacterium]